MDDWEDDGQNDPNADQVNGGPNGDYSLTEARINFQKYYIMYRPLDRRFRNEKEEISLKKDVVKLFHQLNEPDISIDKITKIRYRINIKKREIHTIQNLYFKQNED